MNQQRLLDRFLQYVQCDSESRDEGAFAQLLEEELKQFGLETLRDTAAGEACGSNGWNLYAYRPGEGDPILFSAHMDTVKPGKGVKPVVKDGVITSSGDTILGSDDKSGIAAVMEALECLHEEGASCRPVEVYFTICEEVGLLGSRHGRYDMVRSKKAVVLDSGARETAITRSPSQYKLHIDVKGKSAHAAVSPEKGIHAIKVAAQIVTEIPVGRLDEESVCNISNFSAPGVTNVVAEHASFDMEVRSLSDETAAKHVQSVRDTVDRVCAQWKAEGQVQCEKSYSALHVTDDSPLLQQLCQSFEQVTGRAMKQSITMGGCDAVNFAVHGIESVNIGTGMQNVHGVEEFITVEDLETTAKVVYSMMTAR